MSSMNLIHLRSRECIKGKDLLLNSLFKDIILSIFQENQVKTKEGFCACRNTYLYGDRGEYFALNYQLKNQLKGMKCHKVSHLASFWHSEIVISDG